MNLISKTIKTLKVDEILSGNSCMSFLSFTSAVLEEGKKIIIIQKYLLNTDIHCTTCT